MLQLVVGDLSVGWLHYPWSAIVAVNYLYLLVLTYAFEDRWRWVQSLRDARSSVVALASMVVMTIIFGLTRQDGSVEGIAGVLGFTRMTSSWPFNLLLLNFITSLGLAAVDDWRWVRQRKLAPLLAHTAVFVALVAAMAGSGDKLRLTLPLYLDKMDYVAHDAGGVAHELPFAITLREFKMEEYPPKIYLYDDTKATLSKEFLSTEDSVAVIDSWQLHVMEYLPMAGRMPDVTEYRSMQHVGAAPAAYVVARNSATGVGCEGWVSCGSHIFSAATLPLDDGVAVVMLNPEPKHYLSRIEVQQRDGSIESFDVEVNHPARVGAWRIYQSGYDTERGRWSTMSVVECVRDGWYGIVSVALWMALASAVVMFLSAGGRRVWRTSNQKETKL